MSAVHSPCGALLERCPRAESRDCRSMISWKAGRERGYVNRSIFGSGVGEGGGGVREGKLAEGSEGMGGWGYGCWGT